MVNQKNVKGKSINRNKWSYFVTVKGLNSPRSYNNSKYIFTVSVIFKLALLCIAYIF